MDVELGKKDIEFLDKAMSSYPAFASWSKEDIEFVMLIKAFKYELTRRPRRQILTRIIQLYNAKLTRFNWETAMAMVAA